MAEDKKKKEGGGNPNVPAGAFGGAKDATLERLFPELSSQLFGGPSFSNYNIGGYGQGGGEGEGGGDQRRKLELMADLWRQGLEAQQAAQVRPAEAYEAQARAADPVRFAQQQYQARQAQDPWGPGGQFEGRRAADLYTPEAILASQGNTAENQWAQLGGAKGINPEELKRLNAATYQARKTYV